MNSCAFSFWRVLSLNRCNIGTATNEQAPTTRPIYQPPGSSLPNFGYYNPAPATARSPPIIPLSGMAPAPGMAGVFICPTITSRTWPGSPRQKPAPDLLAHLTVLVPADAELWFENDTKVTGGKGTVRNHASPPLAAGRRYFYTVRAQWQKEGQTVTAATKYVSGPRLYNVDFTSKDG